MMRDKKYLYILFAFITAFLLLLTLKIYKSRVRPEVLQEPDSMLAIRTIPDNYYMKMGIIPHGLEIDRGIVQPGDNIYKLLEPYNVSDAGLQNIISASTDIFNISKLISGKTFYLFYSGADTLQAIRHIIYEPGFLDYFLCTIQDSVHWVRGKKEVTKRVQNASGQIKTSLWDAIVDQKLNSDLIFEMSEIYAWVIDFYRLQPGDRFEVVYEENYIHDEPVGTGAVLASLFKHAGNDFYAFYFEQDGEGGYYDLENKSLRKAFLKAPLKFSRITSGYTRKRFHPILKRFRPHTGIDYGAPAGTPVMSVGDGIVVEAQYKAGNGNYVKIRHNSTYTTQYLHLSRFGKRIRKGIRVSQGEVIGFVGSTGLSTGPHLCFRFWKDGEQINPMKIKIPQAEGVKSNYTAEFDSVKKEMLQKLSKGGEYSHSSLVIIL